MKTRFKISLLLVLWFLAFFPVYPELVKAWFNDSNNTAGVLVPLTSLLLIWLKREELAAAPISSAQSGAWLLAGSLFVYLLSYAGGLAFVSRIMIVFSLVGLVLFSLGRPVYRTIRYPLFHNLFMVPLPVSILTYVSFPLKLFATRISARLISWLSIPVYREGNMLYFTITQLEVAEACSGLRSMMSFLMLSCLFAYFLKGSWRKRILLGLLAIPYAMLANIIRVTGTGVLANFYGARMARGFLHEFSGIIVFFFGFVVLLLTYRLLDTSEKSPAPKSSVSRD